MTKLKGTMNKKNFSGLPTKKNSLRQWQDRPLKQIRSCRHNRKQQECFFSSTWNVFWVL